MNTLREATREQVENFVAHLSDWAEKAWEQRKESERDTKFVEFGRYLYEVWSGQYRRLEKLTSFGEFLEDSLNREGKPIT